MNGTKYSNWTEFSQETMRPFKREFQYQGSKLWILMNLLIELWRDLFTFVYTRKSAYILMIEEQSLWNSSVNKCLRISSNCRNVYTCPLLSTLLFVWFQKHSCIYLYHSTKKPVTTMLTYPWKCTVLHCNHLENTWKPLVLMTWHFDYCLSASEGDNQSVGSSAPVVSRCFPGGYNVKLYISRGRLAWWLLAFLHSVCTFHERSTRSSTANINWNIQTFFLLSYLKIACPAFDLLMLPW